MGIKESWHRKFNMNKWDTNMDNIFPPYIVKTCLANTNAGDIQLNEKLFRHFSKKRFRFVSIAKSLDEDHFLSVGSVLQSANEHSIVWGSGYLKDTSMVKNQPKEILAVRGRLSYERLKLQKIKCPEVFGDAGLLYPRIYTPQVEKKYKLGIIPHYVDQNHNSLQLINNSDIKVIDILSPINNVIDDICRCDVILSSSLHGLIFADAYSVPNYWVKFSDKVLGKGFKFLDYFSSMGRPEQNPIVISKNYKFNVKIFKPYTVQLNLDLDKLYEACPYRRL